MEEAWRKRKRAAHNRSRFFAAAATPESTTPTHRELNHFSHAAVV